MRPHPVCESQRAPQTFQYCPHFSSGETEASRGSQCGWGENLICPVQSWPPPGLVHTIWCPGKGAYSPEGALGSSVSLKGVCCSEGVSEVSSRAVTADG